MHLLPYLSKIHKSKQSPDPNITVEMICNTLFLVGLARSYQGAQQKQDKMELSLTFKSEICMRSTNHFSMWWRLKTTCTYVIFS
uniref:Uncharacterized protein n=1 Tax=Pyxicephalus adspersus TaxID=30357 RepID=A0AAV3B1I9_PYXAD|nr:TPA: hypothetical protein GDO54_000979 [Pyxicephalus adspersus]